MLDQEVMFKKQVHELHELYGVQKKLVKRDSTYPRCELFPVKRTFTECHSVGPSRLLFGQDFGSTCRQKPLDLRLSIGNSYDDDVLDCEELNLSLSIGMGSNKRVKSSRKSLKNMKMVYRPSSAEIIDLTESGPNEILKADLHQEPNIILPHPSKSNSGHDVNRTVLVDIDLNKAQPDEYPSCDGDSYGKCSSQIATSLTSEEQTKTCNIDLESVPEPSSDVTEEKVINISEARKQDYAEEKAALSLVRISQLSLTVNQDSETKPNENKKKTITPSLSVDSYESLVLKLEDSSIEKDSATSKTYEVNECDQSPNRFSLKRGRRLKDFQKDILPALSSLSKHEIWEDIKLLEGVIRSREYKRLNKAKTGRGENTLTPVKVKRAKLNSSGQRSSQRRNE